MHIFSTKLNIIIAVGHTTIELVLDQYCLHGKQFALID